MSSYSSSSNSRHYTADRRHHRPAAPKQEWVPRGSITLSPAADTGSVPSIVQDIQDKLARGAVECMSCYDMVRRSTPIWSCSTCFSIFHLNCIRKWARSPACSAADDWHCPGCQNPQSTPARDLSYTCFCGRLRDPPNDQHLSPHSCGKPCRKPLDGGRKELRCPHICVLQCHPGPCPPCKAFAPRRKCPCGNANELRRCSDRRSALSCQKPCNRFLGCGRHTCERLCHNGACGSCQELVTTKCFCGKKEQEVLCSDVTMKGNFDEKIGLFSCDDVCGRSLLCGNHICRENCHPGLCGECELLPGKISACHCGQKKIVDERMTCMDLIPTCSNVCEKPLVCETHFCRMRCHEGDCLPCSALVQQRCRCGSSCRTVECYQLFDTRFKFICERTCYQKKNCGRHRCKERCCVLSKTGDCDPHLCSLPCDRCSPCLETSCASGMTDISPQIPCDEEEGDRVARKWQITDVFDAFHVGENLATSDVVSDLMWRQPKRVIAIEDIFKRIVLRMPKEGSWSSMKVYALCHIGLKPGFLMVAVYPPAYDPLIDMDPRDPARVATALQRLSDGFTFQGAAMVTEKIGVATQAAARSNSAKWIVALKLDFNEPGWTEASIVVWRGNHGNPVPENANRWEGRLQLEENESLVESLVDRRIADMIWGQEVVSGRNIVTEIG